MKTNKEIIDALVKYFLTQDPEIVARVAAANLIDLNRLWHRDTLPEDEKKCLEFRMKHNVDQLNSFVKNGPKGNLKYVNYET